MSPKDANGANGLKPHLTDAQIELLTLRTVCNASYSLVCVSLSDQASLGVAGVWQSHALRLLHVAPRVAEDAR